MPDPRGAHSHAWQRTFGASDGGLDAVIGEAGAATTDSGSDAALESISLPASFAIVPAPEDSRDAAIRLTVIASVGRGAHGEAAFQLIRVAEMRFAPHRPTVFRIFLNANCGAPAAGCNAGTLPCTISAFCSDRGMTCGNDGRCVPRSVEGSDAGTVVRDAGHDASTDAGCSPNDPCCRSTDPCCGSADPCCGTTNPCCGHLQCCGDGVCTGSESCPTCPRDCQCCTPQCDAWHVDGCGPIPCGTTQCPPGRHCASRSCTDLSCNGSVERECVLDTTCPSCTPQCDAWAFQGCGPLACGSAGMCAAGQHCANRNCTDAVCTVSVEWSCAADTGCRVCTPQCDAWAFQGCGVACGTAGTCPAGQHCANRNCTDAACNTSVVWECAPDAGCPVCTPQCDAWVFRGCGVACGTAGTCPVGQHCANHNCTDASCVMSVVWDCAPDTGC